MNTKRNSLWYKEKTLILLDSMQFKLLRWTFFFVWQKFISSAQSIMNFNSSCNCHSYTCWCQHKFFLGKNKTKTFPFAKSWLDLPVLKIQLTNPICWNVFYVEKGKPANQWSNHLVFSKTLSTIIDLISTKCI